MCGSQDDPKNMALVKGFYGTTINVRNPGPEPVRFEKSLALTLPPGRQEPGELHRIAEEELPPALALAVDCNDLEERSSGFPQRFIEGFVVIRSTGRLEVVGGLHQRHLRARRHGGPEAAASTSSGCAGARSRLGAMPVEAPPSWRKRARLIIS